MPSSPKIPKEMILQTALQMLIRDGYASIHIKAVARELGCSTQPISRHFGNMDTFRAELTKVAGQYVRSKLNPPERESYEDPEQFGRIYCDIAMDEPNLFRFICMGESGRQEKNGMASWLDYEQNTRVMDQMIRKYDLTPENAGKYVQTMIIYFHGIACLIASGLIVENRETIYQMLQDVGKSYLAALRAEQSQRRESRANGKTGKVVIMPCL
ncbi:MAG: TetR/AcrR family transcriptional regulator [Butyricicoccaceae bacterium]